MKHRPHRGFALVVTLTLLVILTVVAVGMLGLSTVSLRSNSQGESMATARANARMAMMLALGELQKELGPDQRISAPGAQLLEENDVTGPKHWTGVYDSWKAENWPFASGSSEEILPDADRDDPKRFRRWLISGDETAPTSVVRKKDAPKDGLSGDKVKLVAATKAQPDAPAQDAVEAGLVKLPKGGSAWWIGDQNTKAKLGGIVEDPVDEKAAAARLQSAPRAAHEVFQGLDGVLPSDERLAKLPSTDSLELLSKDIQPFHDATTTSLGLLTNVRAGGLRKDLNFLLETAIPTAGTATTAALYTVGSTPGINLGELWVDHNIWGELKKTTSTFPEHADGGSIPNSTLYLDCSDRTDPFIPYKHFARLRLTIIYSLMCENIGGKYELYLVAEPVFTIWNPYDVHLRVPTSKFSTLKTWAIPYELNLTLKPPAGPPVPLDRTIKKISDDALFFFYGQLGKTQNLVLRPGEVQVISQKVAPGASITKVPKSPDIETKESNSKIDCGLGWPTQGADMTKNTGLAYLVPDPANSNYSSILAALANGDTTVTWSLTPSARDLAPALLQWTHAIGNVKTTGAGPKNENYLGSFNVDFDQTRLTGENELSASDSDKSIFFPSIPLSAQFSLQNLALQNKKPVCVFTYGLRTEIDDHSPGQGKRYTGRAMLRANASATSQDLFNLQDDIVRTSPLQVGMRPLNDWSEHVVDCDPKGLGFYGASYRDGEGVSYVVTRSIPREPIHSLGALQHAAADGTEFGAVRSEKTKFLQPSVSHAIANSFAPSFLDAKEIRGTLANRPAADHSYLANLALWDNYFYSSIKPRTKSAYKSSGTAYSEQKKRLEDFLATGTAYQPLPNERMRPWTSDPAAVIKAIEGMKPWKSTGVEEAADFTASFLMVDGMFNVNSTSVAAWKSFLSGLKKAKVPSNPSPDLLSQPKMVEAEGAAVAALLEAAGEEIDDSTLGDPANEEQWRGFRSLNDKQINHLAKAIVKQVRKRGPFLSIADFVNRRPGPDEDLAVSGALQSALDDVDIDDPDTDEPINEDYITGDRALKAAEDPSFPFPRAELGAKAIGSPGYVKQGDLLTTLGPMVAVRGDTFVIRGYGEAREGNGPGSKVTARAWCEVTVQRVPDYVDPANNSYDAPADVNENAVNKTFGRRFNIVSFRYLDPREVL